MPCTVTSGEPLAQWMTWVTPSSARSICNGSMRSRAAVSTGNTEAVKQNLLVTCQRCHPEATANFPDSWVGHFAPSPTNQPLVYYINLFYKILVPSVIGAMLLFVGLDFGSRIMRRLRRKGA